GRWELRTVIGALNVGETGDAERLHVEPAAIRPRAVIPITAYGAIDGSGPLLGQLLRREAKTGHGTAAIAVDHDVCARRQFVTATIAIRRLEVQPRRALPHRFIEVEDLVLELLWVFELHHLGALLGERAAHYCSGDHVRQSQHANSPQRTLRLS